MGHLNDSTVRFVDNRRYKPGTENNIRSVVETYGENRDRENRDGNSDGDHSDGLDGLEPKL